MSGYRVSSANAEYGFGCSPLLQNMQLSSDEDSFEEGTSLERIGAVLGYSAGTVRNHLLAAGVVLRDAHGRGEQELAARQAAVKPPR